MQDVSLYVSGKDLAGTDIDGGKAVEGEHYKEGTEFTVSVELPDELKNLDISKYDVQVAHMIASGNDVEINGNKIAAVDFMEIVYNLFVKED
jgi:hypothetical protein